MKAQRIDGKAISDQIKEEAALEAQELQRQGITPCLAVVLVGNDPASMVYVNNKKKACEKVGILSRSYELPEDTEEKDLLALVEQLNMDNSVHGVLVQLPLPPQIDEEKVILAVDPKKDVDCFHPLNVGLLHTGQKGFLPCTPAGVLELIERSGHTIEGKRCVVIGRSHNVGKPTAMLLLQKNGTVTICHSKTKDLKGICKEADILVSAVGKLHTVTKDMVKEGAVVIDVGMNRNENGKLCGDVDFDDVCEVAGAVSPAWWRRTHDRCHAHEKLHHSGKTAERTVTERISLTCKNVGDILFL